MSVNRKLSNPIHFHGLFDVVNQIPITLPVGTQYGFYKAVGAISVGSGDVAIDLISNTSKDRIVEAGYFYSGSLRITKTPASDSFSAYYTPQQPYQIRPSSELQEFAGRTLHATVVTSLGLVMSRIDTVLPSTGDNVLKLEVKHVDWDNETRATTTFSMNYIVQKEGLLSKSLGLFQVGRELMFTGHLIDWDNEADTFLIQVSTVSVTTGQTTRSVVTSDSLPNGRNTPARMRNLIRCKGPGSTPTAHVASGSNSSPSPTVGNVSPVRPPSQAITKLDAEEGELTQSSPPAQFENTYSVKRTREDVLGDARKRMRNKA